MKTFYIYINDTAVNKPELISAAKGKNKAIQTANKLIFGHLSAFQKMEKPEIFISYQDDENNSKKIAWKRRIFKYELDNTAPTLFEKTI